MFQKILKKGVEISMRLRKRKEAVDSIAQKIANNPTEKYVVSLRDVVSFRKIPEKTYDDSNTESLEYRDLLKKVDWLYGYNEEEIPEVLEKLKEKMEQFLSDRDSSHVRILTCIVCHYILSQNTKTDNFNPENQCDKHISIWEEYTLPCESEKISECLDILKSYCPEAINPEGFVEARRYIRIWDSEYNW